MTDPPEAKLSRFIWETRYRDPDAQPLDGGISKTIALNRRFPKASVGELLRTAYDLGLKGCTLYREGARTAIVSGRFPARADAESERGAHCCEIDRESD